MNIPRTSIASFTRLLAVSLCLSLPVAARAQSVDTYPSKPIRLIVPFAPGAANDIIARLIGQHAGEGLGQSIIVENRASAGGAVGANAVAKSPADGYTLAFVNPGPAVITPLLARERLYAVSDLTPIVSIGYAPLVIIAHPSFASNTPGALTAYARANPGKVRWGSADAGGIPGLALTLYLQAAGVDVLAVPYKGGADAVVAVMSNTIDVCFSTYTSVKAQLAAKRLKVIGISGPKRLDAIPEVQTLSEAGISNADAIVWFGLAAPKNTPRAIVERINREVNRSLTRAVVKQRLGELELEVTGGTSEEFAAVVNAEVARITNLIKAGRIKTE